MKKIEKIFKDLDIEISTEKKIKSKDFNIIEIKKGFATLDDFEKYFVSNYGKITAKIKKNKLVKIEKIEDCLNDNEKSCVKQYLEKMQEVKQRCEKYKRDFKKFKNIVHPVLRKISEEIEVVKSDNTSKRPDFIIIDALEDDLDKKDVKITPKLRIKAKLYFAKK